MDHLQNLLVRGSVYVRFAHVRLDLHGVDPFYLAEWVLAAGFLVWFVLVKPPRRLPRFLNLLRRFAQRKRLAVLLVCGLSFFGHLALLTIEPFPAPAIHDEFSYLLGADTIAHGHLTSPSPKLVQHFEAFHVLMAPTYTSMYPPSAFLFYGLGQALTGTPRTGLLLLMAMACGSLCWMLQAYVPPLWAFLGGLISVFHISWFSYFGNTYWGGGAAMLGGCLVLGAAGHLLKTRRSQASLFVLLNLGLLILLNTRPFEGCLLALPTLLFLARNRLVRPVLFSKSVVPGLVLLIAGVAATGFYDFSVTHRAQMPWSLQRQQWANTPPFNFQPLRPHTYEFPDQTGLYVGYEEYDYLRQQKFSSYISVLIGKIFREWIFFLGPALTACFLLGLVPTFRSKKHRPALLSLAFVGVIFFVETWVQPQYMAVATGILYLILMNGLRHSLLLRRRDLPGGAVFSATCVSLTVLLVLRLQFVPLVLTPFTWCSRGEEMLTFQKLKDWLDERPGQQLVIVSYAPNHRWQDSWINNGANIESQKVLWARHIPGQDRELICAYPNREIWLLTPPEEEELVPDTTDPARYVDVDGLLKHPNPGAFPCGPSHSSRSKLP